MTGPSASDDGVTSSERIDALFKALADEHRRQVLRYFQTNDAEIASVEALVDYALERERAPPSRDRLVLTFHHFTLPALAAMDFVEYDPQGRTVKYLGSPVAERLPAVVTQTNLLAD